MIENNPGGWWATSPPRLRPNVGFVVVDGEDALWPVEFSTARELRELATRISIRCIVVTCGTGSTSLIADLARSRQALRGLRHPLVTAIPRDRASYSQVQALIASGWLVRLLFTNETLSPVSLADTLELATAEESATDFLLTQLTPTLDSSLAHLLVPMIVFGGRKDALSRVQAVAARSERGIRASFRAYGLSPKKVVGMVMGFYVAYNAEVCGRSLRECAADAGFATEEAMRRCLRNRTGMLPSEWKRAGVFGALKLLTASVPISVGAVG